MLIKASLDSHGFVNARDMENLWRQSFVSFDHEMIELDLLSAPTVRSDD